MTCCYLSIVIRHLLVQWEDMNIFGNADQQGTSGYLEGDGGGGPFCCVRLVVGLFVELIYRDSPGSQIYAFSLKEFGYLVGISAMYEGRQATWWYFQLYLKTKLLM